MAARKQEPERRQTGIEVRHARTCRSLHGEPCDCTPGFRAFVWSARDERRIQKTFPTEAAALLWREDARVDLRRGVLVAARPIALREFADAWLAGARDGSIRNRSGDRYKPSTLRGYEQALREYVLPEVGGAKLQELRRLDIQRLADDLAGLEISAATVRNALLPLRAICRRALSRGDIQVNPTVGIEIPAVRGRRTRFATPEEAQLLVDAAPAVDRVLWATAFYAGLRRGELQALRWVDVDLAGGVLRVERSWDVKAGVIDPKSIAGRRKVPIAAVLRDYLVAAQDRGRRRPGVRPRRRHTVRHVDDQQARERRLARGAVARDHASRVPPHVRQPDDRGRRQPEGTADLHGSLVDHGHARPLRPPVPRIGGRGCCPPRRLSCGIA